MPRETIRERGSSRAVVVGWQKDTDVQVGTVDDNASAGLDVWYPGQSRPAEGVSTSAGVSSGFFATLDRQGVNDLIRILRKARDAAFGRDE